MRVHHFLSTALALSLFSTAKAFAAPTSIGFAGTMPDFAKVGLETSHVYDYTFSTAPTDWKVASGVWAMTNRWSCTPGFSWFGGRSDETAAIWNKRNLSGDQSAQVYFSFKMGMSGVAAWAEYPTDAAVTICGDGKSLGTGYAFIAGADDNTHSVLMKNGQVVASSDSGAAILPRLTDGKPGNDDVHRRWWFTRVDKTGSKISCYIDDKLVLSYDDPQPIKGGQTAVWTYNNGIMLARIQLYYQNEIRPVYIKNMTAPTPAKPQVAASPVQPLQPKRLAKAIK